jgi:hypothetical protein
MVFRMHRKCRKAGYLQELALVVMVAKVPAVVDKGYSAGREGEGLAQEEGVEGFLWP